MAVFLLKSKYGATHIPPLCSGSVFTDVPCTGGHFDNWIEELAALGITGGCGGGLYCPGNPVTRAQMAVFLLKTLNDSTYLPPAATGTVFADVTLAHPLVAWIEDLYSRAITGGCLVNPLRYCPGNANNRQQMAVFLAEDVQPPMTVFSRGQHSSTPARWSAQPAVRGHAVGLEPGVSPGFSFGPRSAVSSPP